MWSPRLSPIVAIMVAELAATPRVSIRVFQTLVAGKTGQSGAPGSVGAVPTAFDRFLPAVGPPLVATEVRLA